MSNISLIIPSYRNPAVLDFMLRSCVENRVDTNNPILVVLDGFVEESRAIISKYSNEIQVIELDTNVGMAKALNIAGYLAETEWLCIANDDQVMPTRWDERMHQSLAMMSDHKFVMTINQVESAPSMYNFPINATLGNDIQSFQYENWLVYEKKLSQPRLTPDGRIFPFLIQKKHFMAVGGFDCDFFQKAAQCVDYDFFLKLELLDFRFYRTHLLHLYHFGSVVTRKNEEAQRFRQLENDAHAIYQYKWGFPLTNGINNTKLPALGTYRGIGIK